MMVPEPDEDMTVSGSKLEDMDVGEVLASRLIESERILEEEPVSMREYGWNCQSWTVGALEKLERAGFVYADIKRDSVEAGVEEEAC